MRPRKIEEFFEKPFTFDRVARIVFGILLAVLLMYILIRLGNSLVPFVLAWLFAYLMMPMVTWVQKKLWMCPRGVAVTLVLIVTFGVVGGLLALLIPSITKELNRGWELMQQYNLGDYFLSLLPASFATKTELSARIDEFMASVNIQDLFISIEGVVTKSWDIIQSTFDALTGAMVVFIFFFYLIFMMLDYEKVREGFIAILPESTRKFTREVGNIIGFYVASYFRAQALIAFFCGLILSVGFAIIGLPMGISLGIFIGLLNMIPYLQVLGYIPLVLVVGLQSVSTGQNFFLLLLFAVIVILISEVVQTAILTPTIQGKTLGIHPVAIMLSLTVWGYLFGFLGMLLALPITMILYTLYMKYVIGAPVDVDPKHREDILRANRRELWRLRKFVNSNRK